MFVYSFTPGQLQDAGNHALIKFLHALEGEGLLREGVTADNILNDHVAILIEDGALSGLWKKLFKMHEKNSFEFALVKRCKTKD